jgi:hypothetical protein
MIRCDQCDNRIIQGWSFCAYCGYPQTDMGVKEAQRDISERDRLQTDLRHWREECGKLHSQLEAAEQKLHLANTGSLSLLYDIRRELGWNDKTSLDILADGVRRVRRALQTWDTPTGMDLEALALAIKARVVDLEKANFDNKNRIEELAATTEEEDDNL